MWSDWPDDVTRFFPIDLHCFGYEKSDPCLGYKINEEITQYSFLGYEIWAKIPVYGVRNDPYYVFRVSF